MKNCVVIPIFLLGFLASTVQGFVATKSRDHRRNPLVWMSDDEVDVDEQIPLLLNADDEDQNSFRVVLPEINGYTMPSGQKKVGYSAFLEPKKPSWLSRLSRKAAIYDKEMDEDGYARLQRTSSSALKQIARLPVNVIHNAVKRSTVEPGTLILVRHGESEWNRNKTFTGWADPDLTDQGKREVEHAARLLMEGGYKIDVVFTSRLKRAIRSVWILLQEFNEVYLPVFKSWRLNERMVSSCEFLPGTSIFNLALHLSYIFVVVVNSMEH